ncbi:MAG TPA: carboxypeptidase regulatory-like domain-containing protein [Pyrinomonadaceae bacterium]
MLISRRRCSRLLLGMFAVLLLVGMPAASVMAQSITGSIAGTVTDATGGVVVGASVTLHSDQTGTTRTATTGEDGRFTFAALQPGTYSLTVEQRGFQRLERKNAVLTANENLALGELGLQAGQVTETVTVTGEGQIVEKESSDLTARLTSDQLSLISTKGRDVTSLLRLLPGTSNNDDIEGVGDGFGTDLPNVAGARGRSAVASIDGLNAAEPSGSNKLSMTISQDAVAEVKVLRNNYGAEYGNNGGALINLVSKGGGKDYAGSAYYFLRNEALNASNFFNNKSGLKRALYRHNIWGFNIGGPMPLPGFGEGGPSLLRDKAFFFFNLEKPHTITPTDPVFVTVPTALERAGNFSQSKNSSGATPVILDPLTGLAFPGNIIPTGRINKSGQALLNYFPLPNAPIATNPGRYINQLSADVPKHSYVIRFDLKPTDNDSVYWKGQWWTSDNEGLGTSGWPNGANGVDRWGIRSHYLYKDNGWSSNWVHIVNSRIVNEFNFGMRHDSEGFVPSTGMIEGLTRSALNYTAPQLFPANNTLGLVPTATGWTSVAGNPANINWLDRWGEVGQDYIKPSFADNLSITSGDHSYKFGAYFERLQNREAPGGGKWSGGLDFGTSTTNGFTTALGNTNFAYANALLGNFNNYTESQARNFTNSEIRLFQFYAQDQWKLNKKLTLNYGLRVGQHTPFFQRDGQGSNFDPMRFNPAKAPLLYAGYCVGQPNGIPPFGTACSAANQRAVDPRITNPTGGQLLPARLVRSLVPGTGDLLNGLVVPDDPTAFKGFRHTRAIDFEPRVGFAWDIFGAGKTVLRGMGGVYHAPRIGGGTGGAGASSLGANPPEQRIFTINNGNIEDLPTLVQNGAALNFPTALRGLEVNSNTIAVYNFSLGVQQDIGFKTVVEASYVGSFARHLGEQRNLNGVPDAARFVNCSVLPAGVPCHPENRDPLTASSVKNNDFLRPYRGYGDIQVNTWGGTSNYNSLQFQVNRRYTSGFQYGVAYTYSKSFDYANDDTSDVNLSRPYKAFNYAPSDFDQTHILTVNYIYDVPKVSRKWNNGFVRTVLDNWQISGTSSYATGKPKSVVSTTSGLAAGSVTYTAGTVTITAGQTCPPGSLQTSATVCTMITDFTGGQVNARPIITCDPMKGASGFDRSGSPYLVNTACFTFPTAFGQIGNTPRNNLRLPSIFNNDLAFFKNVPIGEKREIQLRWEMYNVFNRANFRDMDGQLVFGLVQVRVDPAIPCSATNICTAVIRQTRDSFGTATSTRSPRVMQASIRINF